MLFIWSVGSRLIFVLSESHKITYVLVTSLCWCTILMIKYYFDHLSHRRPGEFCAFYGFMENFLFDCENRDDDGYRLHKVHMLSIVCFFSGLN